MVKNIFEFLVLCVYYKVLKPKGNVTIFFLITKIYVEIDTLNWFNISYVHGDLKGRDLTQFYDKSPYTNRKKLTTQKKRDQDLRFHNDREFFI